MFDDLESLLQLVLDALEIRRSMGETWSDNVTAVAHIGGERETISGVDRNDVFAYFELGASEFALGLFFELTPVPEAAVGEGEPPFS